MASSPVRTTTLHNYLKEATGLRVSADAAERITALLVAQIAQIARLSREQARDEERNTVLDRDIDQAFGAWLEATAAAPGGLSSADLLAALDGLSNDALTELIQLLQAQL